ncbi:MAG: hypothetical protein MJZ66_09245 [Bacteroidales bacterium]|nr:hypothetical protein [Bacteroidales bacterium]
MRRIVFIVIAALLASHTAMSQSDYGWFVGKASVLVYPDAPGAAASYHYYYNHTNRLSFGMGAGLSSLKDRTGMVAPITAGLKLGLMERRRALMPLIEGKAGYAPGALPGFYAEERIGLETTKIARIRFSLDIGCAHIHNCGGRFFVAAGVLF